MPEQQIKCIGIIMDGNRRWARAHSRPTLEGHNEGYKKLQEFVGWAREMHIPNIVAYAFSTENWQRSEEEVGHLMKLVQFILEHETKKMIAEHIRVRFVGERSRLSEDIQKGMEKTEAATGESYEITLYIALSYGGRAEILGAVNALLDEGAHIATEEEFSKKLWSYPMPDPDMVIRVGEEKRLSNFLPWQSVYSELFFEDTLWPDFSREEFERIIKEFHARERRRGK